MLGLGPIETLYRAVYTDGCQLVSGGTVAPNRTTGTVHFDFTPQELDPSYSWVLLRTLCHDTTTDEIWFVQGQDGDAAVRFSVQR